MGEALGNKTCLVVLNSAISLDLQFEDEHCFHDMHPWSLRYRLPCVVAMEVLDLLIGGSLPVLAFMHDMALW